MSSWDQDSDPQRWYHSSKQAWRHTDEWPSWSEARLDTEAHVTYLEKQVADLRTNVTQLTTRLEKAEVCSLNHEAWIALLSERGSQRQELQFVVEARSRGTVPDVRRQGTLPVAVQDAPRRQSILEVDPWQDAGAREQGTLPVAVQDAPRRQSILQVDAWQDAAARRQAILQGGVAAGPQLQHSAQQAQCQRYQSHFAWADVGSSI